MIFNNPAPAHLFRTGKIVQRIAKRLGRRDRKYAAAGPRGLPADSLSTLNGGTGMMMILPPAEPSPKRGQTCTRRPLTTRSSTPRRKVAAPSHRAGLRGAEFLCCRPGLARSAPAVSAAGGFSAAGAAFPSPGGAGRRAAGRAGEGRRQASAGPQYPGSLWPGRGLDRLSFVLPRHGKNRVRRFPVSRQ